MLDMLHHLHSNFVNVYKLFDNEEDVTQIIKKPLKADSNKVIFINLNLLIKVMSNKVVMIDNVFELLGKLKFMG